MNRVVKQWIVIAKQNSTNSNSIFNSKAKWNRDYLLIYYYYLLVVIFYSFLFCSVFFFFLDIFTIDDNTFVLKLGV